MLAENTTALASAQEPSKADAIKAWHEADTDEKRAAAVKQFPELCDIYAWAAQFKQS